MARKGQHGKAAKRGKAAERADEAAAIAAPRKATRRGGRREQAPDLEANHLSSRLAAEQDCAELLAQHGTTPSAPPSPNKSLRHFATQALGPLHRTYRARHK